jgi:hypothetical protein
MKHILLFLILCLNLSVYAQSICNQSGNLIIYSNYDGGIVTINVDQNIPNLKIGICTYEPVQVTLTGPFVNNVTQVVYGGFNSTQANNNCGLGDFPTSITGVSASIISINTYPEVGYDNPNGWPNLVGVAGACSSTQNAGGGNTPDQVVYYFQQVTGGTFYAHFTQYNCWLNTVYNVSDGGNCCVVPNSSCIPPTIDAGENVTICSGSSIEIGGAPTASGGGSSNYTYSWTPTTGLDDPTSANPIASPTMNTTYTVTVSSGDISCTSNASVDVSIGTEQTLSVTVNGSLTLCPNETVELIAESGYSNYQWSTNETGSSIIISEAGNYSVSAQSVSGCPASSSTYTVLEDTPFTINVTPNGTIDVCDLNSLTLTAETGYSNYIWSNTENSPSISVSETGGYSVSALNANGCSGTSSIVQVNFGISPTASFNYNQLDDYTVQFSCTEPNADSWYWDFGSGNFSTIENPQFDFLYDAIWPVKLIISNECGTDTLNEDVSVIKNGINSIQNQTFSIQQQDGNLFIKSLYPMEFSIYTIQGQLIERKNANAFENQILEIPISHFSTGLYILNFTTTEYQTSIKWIKH